MSGLKRIRNKLRRLSLKKLKLARCGCEAELWGKSPILNQREFIKKTGTFGIFGNLYNNGCGLIAIHNANTILGRDIPFVETYLEFHKNPLRNTICGGLLGTSPLSVKKYFKKAGYKVFSYKSVECLSNAHAAYIIAYIWKKGNKTGAHYAAVEFIPTAKAYKVYNDGLPVKYYANLNDMVKEDGMLAYNILTIDKLPTSLSVPGLPGVLT